MIRKSFIFLLASYASDQRNLLLPTFFVSNLTKIKFFSGIGKCSFILWHFCYNRELALKIAWQFLSALFVTSVFDVLSVSD